MFEMLLSLLRRRNRTWFAQVSGATCCTSSSYCTGLALESAIDSIRSHAGLLILDDLGTYLAFLLLRKLAALLPQAHSYASPESLVFLPSWTDRSQCPGAPDLHSGRRDPGLYEKHYLRLTERLVQKSYSFGAFLAVSCTGKRKARLLLE